MPKFERISMTIEAPLLERLDALVASTGHANRSEFLRDLVRARLVEEHADDDEMVGTLTLVYHHGQRALAERLVDTAHEHEGLVLATMHVHLDRDHCLEVSALRGRQGELRRYARHLLAMRGVLHGELVLTDADF